MDDTVSATSDPVSVGSVWVPSSRRSSLSGRQSATAVGALLSDDVRDIALYDLLERDGNTRAFLHSQRVADMMNCMRSSTDEDGVVCCWRLPTEKIAAGFQRRQKGGMVKPRNSKISVRGYFTQFEALVILVVPSSRGWITDTTTLDAVAIATNANKIEEHTIGVQNKMLTHPLSRGLSQKFIEFMQSLSPSRDNDGRVVWTHAKSSQNVRFVWEHAESRMSAAFRIATRLPPAQATFDLPHEFPVLHRGCDTAVANMHLIDGSYQYVPVGEQPVSKVELTKIVQEASEHASLRNVCKQLIGTNLLSMCTVTAAVHGDPLRITVSVKRKSIGQLHFNVTSRRNLQSITMMQRRCQRPPRAVNVTVESIKKLVRRATRPRSHRSSQRSSEQSSQQSSQRSSRSKNRRAHK